MNQNIEKPSKDVLNQTWYVRRKDKITGPFPGRLISRRLLLGQVLIDDELSLDQFHWQSVSELQSLIPDVMKSDLDDPVNRERIVLSKRWADERSSRNRRETGVAERGEARPTTDRRDSEKTGEIDYRKRRDQRLDASRNNRKNLQKKYKRRQRIQSFTIVFLVVAAVLFSLIYAPAPEVNEKTNCLVQPETDIVWANCQLAGISYPESNLSGADIRNANLSNANLSGSVLLKANLSYSNLSHVNFRASDLSYANLKGANLQKTNLKEANLSAADLSYADLTGAKLRGADFSQTILSKTIWVDGRECGLGSVGTCRQ